MNEGWRRVAQKSDVKNGVPHRVAIDADEIALHRVGGEIFATANICTHAWARLSDGYLEDHHAICPMHEGGFDVRTGEAAFAPCSEALATYAVKIEGDEIFILWKQAQS